MVPGSWILISLVVGIFLVFVPWWPGLWDSNWLLQQLWPPLRGPLLSPFMRGAVTGLGLVNIFLALHDAFVRLVAGDRGPGGAEEGRGLRGPGD